MSQTNKNEKVRILLALPEELRDQLKESAEKEHRSLTNYIVSLLADHEAEKRK